MDALFDALHFNVIPPAHLDTEAAIDLLHRCETALFEVIDALDGSISAEHGIGRAKKEASLERLTPVQADLLSCLKRSFDPHHLMNRGRLLEMT